MTVIGITMVKDESDIIEATVRHMLAQVDYVIVADNGSTDGTLDLLHDLHAEDLTVVNDLDPAHYQSRKMSQLAQFAASDGGFWKPADWVVPFDADEAWYSPFGRIADVLGEQSAAIAPALIYNHRATGVDPVDPNPLTRMGWRERDHLPLQKVACRPVVPVTIGEGNHNANYDTAVAWDLLIVRHFPYRSVDQFVSKARNGSAALAATDLPEDIGKHWRDYGRLLDAHGPETLHDVFREHFYTADPTDDPRLIYDPVPCPVSTL